MAIYRWYAVTTQPRHEKVVAEQLQFKSIEAYLPTVTRPAKWKDRSVLVERPIFPGYVFTRIDLSERNHVFSIPGVVKMLSFDGKAAPIEDAEIEAIRLCLNSENRPELHSFMRVGERVRVLSGQLAGLTGLVVRHKNRCRIIVSIALIHQSIAVEIDANLLESLQSASQGSLIVA